MTSPPVSTQIALPLEPGVARQRLSKSRFVAGKQCHRLLWWKVHEPLAVELQPDKVLQDRFDQGAQVGALARERFPGGVLIEATTADSPADSSGASHPRNDMDDARSRNDMRAEQVERTRRAIDAGASVIFEASFVADNTFVAVDVLLREVAGWRLIEVKSASSQKEEHLLDVAVQAHVLALSGVDVVAMEVMHLSKDFRNPDRGELFERTDVTAQVRELLPAVHAEIEAQLAILSGSLPDVAVGLHCHEPRECPFMERCWPKETDHIRLLYNVGPKRCHDYMTAGVHRIGDIPPKQKLPEAAKRQIRAMQENCLIVDPGLHDALEPFDVKLGFLDFETIQRAVPVWPGMAPWEQAAAQFSYHYYDKTVKADKTSTHKTGTADKTNTAGFRHDEFLAEGAEDARPLLAERMIEATAGAERVVTYSAFEKTRIRGLQLSVPQLKGELKELEGKLIDLLPVLRDHVYHPDFHGSFSLKYVLTPLVPELTYSDLVIVDGLVASVEIARLLFVAQKIPVEERARVRGDLLKYCERDTWAMVRLLGRMRQLADGWRPRPDLKLI